MIVLPARGQEGDLKSEVQHLPELRVFMSKKTYEQIKESEATR